ncbi:Formyl-CoA:oxalate CoA-transferase [compost metagenome]
MNAPDKEVKKGPLAGIRIIELAGMGAEVLRIERPGDTDLGVKRERRFDLMLRNRKSIALGLKDPRGVATALELVEQADALIEGFRSGVTGRMGLGPDACFAPVRSYEASRKRSPAGCRPSASTQRAVSEKASRTD